MKLLYMPHKKNFLYYKRYYSYMKISGFKGSVYDFILVSDMFILSFLIGCV